MLRSITVLVLHHLAPDGDVTKHGIEAVGTCRIEGIKPGRPVPGPSLGAIRVDAADAPRGGDPLGGVWQT